MSTDENPTPPKSGLQPEHFFHPGTTAEQVEVMMGVLTQGVVDCMIFATGAYPNLTEGLPEEPNAFARPKPGGLSSWQAARSAELRDAARLTEAGARLLTGFAKLRGQFSQDFTIRHTEKKAGGGKPRQRASTITHSFSVPAREALPQTSLDPQTTSGLTRKLADVVDSLAESRGHTGTTSDKDKQKKARAEIYRRLGILRDANGGDAGGDGAGDDGAGDAPDDTPLPPVEK